MTCDYEHDQEGVINEDERDENKLTHQELDRLLAGIQMGATAATAVPNRTLKRLLAIERRWDAIGRAVSDQEDVEMLKRMDQQDLRQECVRRFNITRRMWTGVMKIYGQEGFSGLLDYVKG